ncbi:MAG: hypothetical protein K2X91_12960, partial [Thermoleophilia bacterium]|nr:hypothetical protein [Thermoleophilia bacterium]
MESIRSEALGAEVRVLAGRWPRELIQAGEAESLANGWVTTRRLAWEAGRPPFAQGPLSTDLAAALFEARR